ncbi:hypothetical protein OROGR_022291 [Orobanche gracilis]
MASEDEMNTTFDATVTLLEDKVKGENEENPQADATATDATAISDLPPMSNLAPSEIWKYVDVTNKCENI